MTSKDDLSGLREFSACREQLQDLYVRLHDLIDYNTLNKEGFRKALKKHDKVLSRVAPKRLDVERPRWEATLSDTSKEKLQVCHSLTFLSSRRILI